MPHKKTIEAEPTSMVKPTIELYLRTGLLIFSWLILGICNEIIGPTMSVLAHNIHVTYSGIATVLASCVVGGLLITILCGIFQKLVNNNQDLMLIIGFLTFTIVDTVIPFIRSFLLMCIAFFFTGFLGSLAIMGSMSLLFKIWGNRSAAPVSLVNFGYAVGAILANLLVRLFSNNNKPQTDSTLSSPLNLDVGAPYWIAAVLSLVTAIGHFIFFLRGRKDKRRDAEEQKADYTHVSTVPCKTDLLTDEVKYSQYSPAVCGRGYFGYGLSLSILFTIYMFFVSGTDQTFAKFYFSYLKFDKFGISTDGASWGIILFWSSFSIGRLIGAIESLFIPVHICLAITWCGGLLLATAWMVYVWILGLTSTTLFVLGSLTGFIISPLFPVSLAWINQKLNVIPFLLAVVFCGYTIGLLVLQKIAGYVMDSDPNHFPTLITACVITAICLFIVINVIIFFHERTVRNAQEITIDQTKSSTERLSDEERQLANYLQDVNEMR